MPKTRFFEQKYLWIFLPVVIWIGLFCLRPAFYHPWCAVQQSPCTEGAVNPLDQIVFQFHSRFADFLSNLVQNTVGVILFLLPALILKDWRRIFSVERILLTGTLWNGAFLELARVLAQRPRPLVMKDPLGDGSNIHQYTSFYSGHTSFVAFAGLATFLWMRSEYGPASPKVRSVAVLAVLLTLFTATLRVLGRRHFPSDTLAGALAGSLVAIVVWAKSKSDRRELSLEQVIP